MYLLFRRGASILDKTRPLSVRNFTNIGRPNLSEKTCLLCKRLENVQWRGQSSVTNPNVKKTKRKPKMRSFQSYADILIVTKKSSKHQRANVTKLKGDDLNLLARSNINLNELYKLRNYQFLGSHTYCPLTTDIVADDNVPLKLPTSSASLPCDSNLEAINIEDQVFEELEENELDINMKVKDSLQPEEIEEVPPPDIPKTSKCQTAEERVAQLQHHWHAVASRTLAAYIEVCNHLRNPTRGLSALQFHQYRAKKEKKKNISSMKDVNVYQTLLKGFANKGDYQKLTKVVNIMKEEKVEPNLHCYTAILECLARVNVDNHYIKEIRKTMKEAIRKEIDPKRMLNEGIFLNDERQVLLKAFTSYNPNFARDINPPKVFYKNHLLDHLNDRKQLSLDADSYGGEKFIDPKIINKLVDRQLAAEEKGFVVIKSIERKQAPTKEVNQFRTILNDHYKMWAESAQKAFQRDLAAMAAQKNPLNLEPFLRSIPVSDMVEIITQEATTMTQGSETYSPEVFVLHKRLGSKVYARYRILRKEKTRVLDKTLSIHKKYCEHYANSREELDAVPLKEDFNTPRITWQLLQHNQCKDSVTLKMGHQAWIPVTLSAIGRFLYHIIMHDLKIDVNSMRPTITHKNHLPAFYTIFRSQGRIVKEEIKPHPVLSKLYKASEPETLTFPTYEVPMVCPPIPWTTIDNGGYLISPSRVVRLPYQASSQENRMADADPVQLYPNLDALSQLASVPWKVNKSILDVLMEVFRSGGSAKLDVPEPPSSLTPPPAVTPDMDKNQRYQIYKQKLQQRRKKSEMFSMWCDCLYRLSLANHFRDDVFWLPHNMDFRGRVYPVPPHLNHLGSDLARSMLVFAEARPLGPNGLDWLKIHLINLTGLKKRDSVKDRLDYANEIIHLILDSADHPLTGQKWWVKSDEPWQTLACCMEVANVIRSGMDPALYKSHFPVHQDGSCNGLQHYAALGRDSAGAYSVNLAPSDVPQDVYSAVVGLVEEQRARDEANGVEIAKILNGYIKRKVIKQTIMTTVYGVTRFGARLQIMKQLKDIDDFPRDALWGASAYLTSRTFESLRTMFTSTKEIQDWFTECSRLVSGVNGALLEWVSPLGLPIVQPYIKYKPIKSVKAGYEGFAMDQFSDPSVMKQKNAFPPNFIHSLDSCHMMLTSLHCARAGITFVSVHDCYWTHPSTIHIMNKICREQFVALHSEPILENLSDFLYDLYSYDESDLTDSGSVSEQSKRKVNKVLKQLPPKGDFDINNVLNSVYFFS